MENTVNALWTASAIAFHIDVPLLEILQWTHQRCQCMCVSHNTTVLRYQPHKK